MVSRRPLTEEEQREASRARVAGVVWQLKLFTDDETVDLVTRLEQEAPQVLAAIRQEQA